MKNLPIGIFVFLAVCNFVSSDTICGIDGIDETTWKLFLKLPDQKQTETHEYNFIRTSQDNSILSQDCTDDIPETLEASLNDTHLVIPFSSMKDEELRSHTDGKIYCRIFFQCPNNEPQETLNIQITILDVNEAPPVFNIANTEISVPMPMLPKIDIFQLIEGDGISVTDEDFSNNDITFTVSNPDDFNIESKNFNNTYIPTLKVTKPIVSTKDITLTVTATDSGDTFGNKLSSTLDLTLKVDADSSDIQVKFSEPFYTFEYKINKEEDEITPKSGDIILSNAVESVTPSLDRLTDNFNAKYDEASQKITIELSADVPEDELKTAPLILTLTVTYGKEIKSSVPLIFTLPTSSSGVEFSKPYYTMEYNTTDKSIRALEGDVTVSEDDAKVTISADDTHKGNFLVEQDESNKKVWKISAGEDLLPDDLKRPEITIVLEALIGDQGSAAKTAVVFQLVQNDELPVIEKPHYSASYKVEDGKASVELTDGPIVVSPSNAEVNIIQDGNNFKLTPNGDDPESYDLQIDEPLNEDQLKLDEILITIEAKLNGLSAYATVVIKILKTKETPEFSSKNYAADYDSEKDLIVPRNGWITLTNENAEKTEVTIEEGDHKDLFEISRNDQNKAQWVIKNKSPLKVDVSDVILTLKAALEDETTYVTYVLSIEKSVEIWPKLEKPHYSARYDDGKVVITDGPIKVISENSEDTKLTLQDYTEYFHLNEKNEVDVIKPLDEDIMEKGDDLIITIEAKLLSKTSYATLIISLPGSDAPEFSKAFYTGNYEIVDENPKLYLDDEITVIQADAVSLKEEEYRENFDVSKNEKGVWVITATKILDEAVLNGGKDLFLTLEARINGKSGVGRAPLIITLPSGSKKAPTFKNVFYTGNYILNPEDDSANVTITSDQIAVDPSESQVEIIEEYETYFKATQNGETWDVIVIKLLPKELLEAGEVLVTLEATFEGLKSYSTLVISTPNSKKGPSFSEIYYTASYVANTDGGADELSLTNGPIVVNGDYKDLTLEGEYADFFKLEGTNSYDLVLNGPLDSQTLKLNDIVVILKATDDQQAVSYAPIVISITKNGEEDDLPLFEKLYYNATYGTDNAVVVDGSIQLIGNKIAEADVDVGEDYHSYFKAVHDKKGTVTFSVLDKLTDEILKRSFIVVTLEATVKGINGVSKTMIVVKLPSEKDPVVTSVRFEKESYIIPLSSGLPPQSLLTVKATSTKNEKITYSIISENTEELQVVEASGEIKSTKELKAGVHSIDVMAMGETSTENDTAPVIISVSETIICPDGPRTAFSLKKIHIKEGRTYCKSNCDETEVIHLQPFNDQSGVTFTITDVIPENFKDNFTINESGTAVELSEKLSRDDNQLLRDNNQIILTIEANDATDFSFRNSFARATTLNDDNTREYLYLGDLENKLNVLNVVVIIDDTNDYKPVFETYSKVLGYPKKELAAQIMPQYLTIVKATDRDAGSTPEDIIYESPHENVYIDSTTGQVYLSNNFAFTEFSFDVTATDEKGEGQVSNPLTITVKMLDEENIFLLSTDNTKLSEIEDKLRVLSERTKVSVNALSVGIMPSLTKNKQFEKLLARVGRFRAPLKSFNRNLFEKLDLAADPATYTVQIIAYAIDSGTPLTRDEFQGKLSDDDWSVSSWNKNDDNNGGDGDNDKASNTGLIAGVSILAVLLVITAAVLLWMYLVKVRRLSSNNNFTDATSIDSADKIFTKNPRLTAEKFNNNNDTLARRPTGFLFEKREKEEDEVSNSEQPQEASFERRKSVAFDDNVETLQIEGRDEKAQDEEEEQNSSNL